MADLKAYRLEISEPDLRFVVIYTTLVRTQTGKRISGLGPAIETGQTALSSFSGRSYVNA